MDWHSYSLRLSLHQTLSRQWTDTPTPWGSHSIRHSAGIADRRLLFTALNVVVRDGSILSFTAASSPITWLTMRDSAMVFSSAFSGQQENFHNSYVLLVVLASFILALPFHVLTVIGSRSDLVPTYPCYLSEDDVRVGWVSWPLLKAASYRPHTAEELFLHDRLR